MGPGVLDHGRFHGSDGVLLPSCDAVMAMTVRRGPPDIGDEGPCPQGDD